MTISKSQDEPSTENPLPTLNRMRPGTFWMNAARIPKENMATKMRGSQLRIRKAKTTDTHN